jgi:RNA exonuclease 4
MAIFRLHRTEWEKGNKRIAITRESRKSRKGNRSGEAKGLGMQDNDDGEDEGEAKGEFSGGGRKGVSSGLSTVVRRSIRSRNREVKSLGSTGEKKKKWWKELASR